MHDYTGWLEKRIGRTFDSYEDLWGWSVADLPAFWESIWDYCDVRSSVPWTQVLGDSTMPGAEWFAGARLNYAENVLRHDGPTPALIAIGETGQRREVSWDDLRAEVAALAATLHGLGVSRGDRVVGYLPNIPEAVVAFLASASIGAVWSSCSPDFGAASVVARFEQIEPKVLIAADGYRYAGRVLDRRDVVEQLRRSLPSVEHTIAVPYMDAGWTPDDALMWDSAVATSAPLRFEQVPSDHPLWILYSSGTTGAPKGIVHGHGGVTVDLLAALALHMDLDAGDTCFWFTTTGWVMWNIVVSTLMRGCTAVLYDGSPGHPDPGRLWQIAAETQATLLGVGAAYIHATAAAGVVPGRDYDLGHLSSLSFTGSPLSPELYSWVYEAVDPDIWFSSVSGGTDVCGPFVGGNPMLPVRAGEIQCRCLGINVQAFDAQGQPLVDAVGELVVTAPMPSMPLFLWGDDDTGTRYRDTYFDVYPGVWRHGDWIKVTSEGGVIIYGRSDATINRAGVRIGSAEIYRAVEALPEIADSLVVDLSTPEAGEVVLFVVLEDDVAWDEGIQDRIRTHLREVTSPRHVPDEIVSVQAIPKTLNNKKLEVPIRRLLQGADVNDALNLDSVSNRDALQFFVELAATRGAQPTTNVETER